MTIALDSALRASLDVQPDASAVDAFVDYYRCPPDLVPLCTATDRSTDSGFFQFGGARGYGRVAGASPALDFDALSPDVTHASTITDGAATLPFDLAEVVTALRRERYVVPEASALTRLTSIPQAETLYYWFRPRLPVAVRRHLQQLRLRSWQRIPFPCWPVDSSVDGLFRGAAAEVLRATGAGRLPFIWFWPDGAPTCTTLTHDVEGRTGLEFCQHLIDLDASFGMRAAFQLIPEGSEGAFDHADAIRASGCEVNLHDLNHDGRLYRNETQFRARAARINAYAQRFGCRGFRSGVMYRNQEWYDALDVDYDMSVPNVSHLEPQRGGCCTVMPYFVGRVLEIPLTTAQDYSLFCILEDYSTRLWQAQIAEIRKQNGLISVIAHPDYLQEARARDVYVGLLKELALLRDRGETWMAQPSEINEWWRERRDMTLTAVGSSWRVEGSGSERARVAYAALAGDQVVYSLDAKV